VEHQTAKGGVCSYGCYVFVKACRVPEEKKHKICFVSPEITGYFYAVITFEELVVLELVTYLYGFCLAWNDIVILSPSIPDWS